MKKLVKFLMNEDESKIIGKDEKGTFVAKVKDNQIKTRHYITMDNIIDLVQKWVMKEK